MGKIIISESQYRKVKQALIESEITKSFLTEQNFTVDNMTGFVTIKNYLEFGVKRNYTLYKVTISKGGKLYPTSKGDVKGKVLVKVQDYRPFAKQNFTESSVIFICRSNKININNKIYEVEEKELVKKICESAKISEKNTKVYGIGDVGGGGGYVQKSDQILDSTKKGGNPIRILKNTGYKAKKTTSGATGATFRFGNSFGWFDCKYKNFSIYKDKNKKEYENYTNKDLADALSKFFCNTSTAVGAQNLNQSVGSKSGSGTRSGSSSSSGGGTSQDTMTDFLNYI
jgi:hypothetical protein